MSLIRTRSLRSRLALALLGAALLAFVVAGAGLVLYQRLTLEDRARQMMQPYAQLVSVGTDAAVAFENAERAQEILDTLRANPNILEADIFLGGGRHLAGFSRLPRARPPPAPARADGVYLGPAAAELLQGLPRDARLRLVIGLGQLGSRPARPCGCSAPACWRCSASRWSSSRCWAALSCVPSPR